MVAEWCTKNLHGGTQHSLLLALCLTLNDDHLEKFNLTSDIILITFPHWIYVPRVKVQTASSVPTMSRWEHQSLLILASYAGPLNRGRKGLVHILCSCVPGDPSKNWEDSGRKGLHAYTLCICPFTIDITVYVCGWPWKRVWLPWRSQHMHAQCVPGPFFSNPPSFCWGPWHTWVQNVYQAFSPPQFKTVWVPG